MKGKLLLVVISIVMLVIITNFVGAIGITPGRTTMDFSPNVQSLDSSAQFTVVNTDAKDMNVAFTIEGELKDYITLDSEVVSFSKDEKQKSFSYRVQLSENAGLDPGLHTADIVVVELPEDIDNPGMVVKATVSVVTQLYVFVLYPGKHLEASLDIVDKDGKVYFYIPLISRGNETINSVSGEIIIYENGKKVENFATNDVSLEASEKKELTSVWTDPGEGNYKAVAEIDYDGQKETIEKEFSIGEDLGVIGVSVDNFLLGDIAKIKILVQNKLERVVKEVFANLEVFDSDLNEIEDLNSEHYEIPAKSNKEMVVYWDTEKLQEGIYDSELRIDYDEDFINKKFKIEVSENSMEFKGVGFVISEQGSGRPKFFSFLYIIIGALVLINLGWLVWCLRNKRKIKK